MAAAAPQTVGFWSYSRPDGDRSRGKLGRLRQWLEGELQGLIGRQPDVRIFHDVDHLAPGTVFASMIEQVIADCRFFIPVVTPSFLQSEWCCRELGLFHQRQTALGRDDLIFPLHYIDIEAVAPEQCCAPEMLPLLRDRQWIDLRPYRLADPNGARVALRLAAVAKETLNKSYATRR